MPRPKKSTSGRSNASTRRKNARKVYDSRALASLAMVCAMRQGITPDAYSRFCTMFSRSELDINKFPVLAEVMKPTALGALLREMPDPGGFDMLPATAPKLTRSGLPRKKRRVGHPAYRYTPLSSQQAADLTYKVRLSLKDVKSPPLWREVTLSPSVSLLKVALIGLALFQMPESTPWVLLPSPGSTECSIGVNSNEVTFNASEVELSAFLQKKNDKITLSTGNGVWNIEIKLVEIDPHPLVSSRLTDQKGGGFISSVATPSQFELLREIASYTGPKLLGGYRKVLDDYGFADRNALRHAILARRSADELNQAIASILARK